MDRTNYKLCAGKYKIEHRGRTYLPGQELPEEFKSRFDLELKISNGEVYAWKIKERVRPQPALQVVQNEAVEEVSLPVWNDLALREAKTIPQIKAALDSVCVDYSAAIKKADFIKIRDEVLGE